MTRLKFKFKRTFSGVEEGTVSIDANPSDYEGILKKLRSEDFSEFVVTSREIIDPEWDFH